jgi:hypothetical protein
MKINLGYLMMQKKKLKSVLEKMLKFFSQFTANLANKRTKTVFVAV